MTACGLLLWTLPLILLTQGQETFQGRTHALEQSSGYETASDQQSGESVGDEMARVGAVIYSPAQDWREMMSRRFGFTHQVTVNDFLSMLRNPDGTNVTEADVFVPDVTRDGKRVISGSGRSGDGLMAVSDECSPRNVSVRLDLDYSQGDIAYYPECTMIERCGGCTPTPYISCEPRYKEKIVLNVLKAIYPYPGAVSMHWMGYVSVEVERHLTCQIVCNLQPGDCGPLKQFMPYQCKCSCLTFERCSNAQTWNEDTCSCRCSNITECCPQQDDRTCTMFYDHEHCECTLKTHVGASPDASHAEVEAWLASRNRQLLRGPRRSTSLPFSSAPPTSPSTPATTTTASSTPSTPADPCADLTCPRDFQKYVTDSGSCRCQLRFFGRRRQRG